MDACGEDLGNLTAEIRILRPAHGRSQVAVRCQAVNPAGWAAGQRRRRTLAAPPMAERHRSALARSFEFGHRRGPPPLLLPDFSLMSKARTVTAGGVLIVVLAILTIVTWSSGLAILAVLLAVALVGVGWALVDNVFVYRGAPPAPDGSAAEPGPNGGSPSATGSGMGTGTGTGTEAKADEDVHPAPAASAPPPAS
jgi:hypothetical protein